MWLILAMAWASIGVSQGKTVPVQVRETTINLPIYLLGREDPNPPFALVNADDVYPYTMLDDLTDNRETKSYKAIVLENQYLRATILPELGARLYSLFDKTANREVFYRNHVVKYGLVGLRGAWISGGIEFNFPNGHTTDTVSPVSSCYWRDADGSASVVLGDVDQVSGMYWQVNLTLRPDESRLEEGIKLFNPTPLENLYWYWNNAAVPATEGIKFVYPMREVTPNSRSEYWTYPEWKGVDYSRYRNIRQPTEMFGDQVHRDFFGVYYPESDFGVIHVADYREVPGKKIWTWGVAGDGLIWTRLLTDDDGPYNEIQSGRFETQLNREFMLPHSALAWTEYWYPVQGLGGGFTAAAKDLAVNLRFLPGAEGHGEVSVVLSPTMPLLGTTLTISVNGKPVRTLKGLSLAPPATRTFSVPVDDIEAARATTAVDISDASGKSLLHWSAGEPIDGNPDFVSKENGQPVHEEKSAQGLFLQGLRAEKEGRRADAEARFNESLSIDPEFLPALRQLAVWSYRAANYDRAETYIRRALRQNGTDAQTVYLAGVIDRAAGRLSEAEDSLWTSLRLGISPPQALAQLGEIALSRGEYTHAAEIFRRAVTYSPMDPLVQSDLAAAVRLSGSLPQASSAASSAVKLAPLYPIARAEEWRVAAGQGATVPTESAQSSWRQTVGDRMQSYLEAAAWYWSFNDWSSSDFVLKAAMQRFSDRDLSPMMYYYLASNALHEGMADRAREYAAKARAASYEAIFPNRSTDVAVLEEALRMDPADAHAQYFLANFLFQYGRYAEAAALWRSAEKAGFHYATLYRNLGIYSWRVRRDLPEAAALYRKAVAADPADYRFYVDLDEIYTQQGPSAVELRKQLFSNAPVDVLNHDPARLRYALLLIEEGQFAKAVSLLDGHAFKPWEQGDNPRDVFVLANLEEGRQALRARDFKGAQASFERALEYPANLGIGKPDKVNDWAALYWLGVASEKQGDVQGAERAWKTLLGEGAASDLSRFYKALAMKATGRDAAARETIQQLSDGPAAGRTSVMNYYVAGLAEVEKQDPAHAIEDFHKALEINPLSWQAQIELNREMKAERGSTVQRNAEPASMQQPTAESGTVPK